jgi:hypothetical protein
MRTLAQCLRNAYDALANACVMRHAKLSRQATKRLRDAQCKAIKAGH